MSTRYGKQTKLALDNFNISGEVLPETFIRSLVMIKAAAAVANFRTGGLQASQAEAIEYACQDVLEHFEQNDFPIDIFQTGSGTSTNMNVNEVLAHIANDYLQDTDHADLRIHPNDHINKSQSSNDTIPSALHLSAVIEIQNSLQPALQALIDSLDTAGKQFSHIVKTGRTHLMDAMPIRCDQEISAWKTQIEQAQVRIGETYRRLCQLPLGGTAVGTGINADQAYVDEAFNHLRKTTGLPLEAKANYFEGLSCQDTAVEYSGQLKVLAVALMKIANDLRWMNSGPYCGLAEITLPELQPGSSIMPGKVNPVIPEAVAMAAAQVIGNDACITIAGQSGQFQLNVMLPVIARNVLHSTKLLANSCHHLADKALNAMSYNERNIAENLSRNPILVTALNTHLGYELCAKIAKESYQTGEAIVDVAMKYCDYSREKLLEILDPKELV